MSDWRTLVRIGSSLLKNGPLGLDPFMRARRSRVGMNTRKYTENQLIEWSKYIWLGPPPLPVSTQHPNTAYLTVCVSTPAEQPGQTNTIPLYTELDFAHSIAYPIIHSSFLTTTGRLWTKQKIYTQNMNFISGVMSNVSHFAANINNSTLSGIFQIPWLRYV